MLERSALDSAGINTIPTLAMDAVQAANSGHPGAPMALAPVACCLWQQFLRFDPQDGGRHRCPQRHSCLAPSGRRPGGAGDIPAALNDKESASLRASAQVIRKALDDLGEE